MPSAPIVATTGQKTKPRSFEGLKPRTLGWTRNSRASTRGEYALGQNEREIMIIPAIERLVTRPWPAPFQQPKPVQQIRSTHTAVCQVCSSEIRLKVGPDGADIFGSCAHVKAIEQSGIQITVRFSA